MTNNNIFQDNIEDILKDDDEKHLYKYIQLLSLSFDDIHDINLETSYETIENIYYNSYFIIINSIKLFNTNYWNNLNKSLKKAAESLEILSNLNNAPINKNELLFDALLVYSITDYYSRAYVLSNKTKHNIKLPKYKEVIFQFINRDLLNLRNNLLTELNSENYDEKILINRFKFGQINKFEVIEHILSYSIFKSLNYLLNYIYTGNKEFIKKSLKLLEKYSLTALKYGFVEFSWTIDILKILIEKFYENSLWNQLDSFNNKNEFHTKLKKYILNYALSEPPLIELWPSQIKAIPEIIKNDNFTIKMPTSAGKTLIAELVILKFLMDNDFSGKIVYLAPFKSLSQELEIKFKKSLSKIGIVVSEFYGNFEIDPYGQKLIEDYDLFILTPEKFDSILRTQNGFKNNIGLVIIDEGHIIGDGSKRGLNFELFIERIKTMFNNSRLIFISGVLPNMEDFSKWLTNKEGNLISSSWKPSEVLIGVLNWNEKNADICYFNEEFDERIKFMSDIYTDDYSSMFPKKSGNDALALSALKFANEGQTFIFTPVKKHILPVARSILKMNSKLEGNFLNLKLKINKDDKDILYLKKLIIDELGEGHSLLKFLECGFLIHHADLPERIKVIIEQILMKNKVKLVIGTNTLTQGVNFHIKTVLIKDIYRNRKLLDEPSILNIIGRAGRANKENNARVLLILNNLDKNRRNKEKIFKKLVNSETKLESSLKYILNKIRDEYKNSNINFEDFCFNIAQNITDDSLKEIINSLDKELFSFIEENKDLENSELLDLIIKFSLFHVQFPDNTEELKILINSRINYLKKKYSKGIRSNMYKLGFSLPSCIIIEENYKFLNMLFYSFNDWFNLNEKEKVELLYNIAIFFFKKEIFQTNTYYNTNFFDEKDEEILKYWIMGLTISEIYKKLDDKKLKLENLSLLINSFKTTLPWLISNTLIFLKNQNIKYGINQLNPICENIPTMFQYGIFDLKMATLLVTYNDLNLCEKLYNDINIKNSHNYNELLHNIEELQINSIIKDIPKESRFLIRNYSKSNYTTPKISIKILSLNNYNIKEEDVIIIKHDSNYLSLFSIEGQLIVTCKKSLFKLSGIKFNEIKINYLWKVNSNNNYFIFKKI